MQFLVYGIYVKKSDKYRINSGDGLYFIRFINFDVTLQWSSVELAPFDVYVKGF